MVIILVIHLLIAIALVGAILLQKKEGGMGGLGGGSGGMGGMMSGRAKSDLLSRTTGILAAAFFITSLALAVIGTRGTQQGPLVPAAEVRDRSTSAVPATGTAEGGAPAWIGPESSRRLPTVRCRGFAAGGPASIRSGSTGRRLFACWEPPDSFHKVGPHVTIRPFYHRWRGFFPRGRASHPQLSARFCRLGASKIRLRKLDPYLNVDPGTMSPYQHGEVYVTDDGAETDLDLGHYERFTGVSCRKTDSVTTGKIYSNVIAKERRSDYLGATIQVIPHVTDAIKEWIKADLGDEDFVLCEIGGTVGDIESLPFLEAIRQLGNELGKARTMFVHLTLVPYIPAAGELKTKPTQHSVKELQAVGIQPDLLLCRSDREIPADSRRKIAQFCNVRPTAVIQALDVDTIYAVPLAYHAEGYDGEVCRHFGIEGNARSLQVAAGGGPHPRARKAQ